MLCQPVGGKHTTGTRPRRAGCRAGRAGRTNLGPGCGRRLCGCATPERIPARQLPIGRPGTHLPGDSHEIGPTRRTAPETRPPTHLEPRSPKLRKVDIPVGRNRHASARPRRGMNEVMAKSDVDEPPDALGVIRYKTESLPSSSASGVARQSGSGTATMSMSAGRAARLSSWPCSILRCASRPRRAVAGRLQEVDQSDLAGAWRVDA